MKTANSTICFTKIKLNSRRSRFVNIFFIKKPRCSIKKKTIYIILNYPEKINRNIREIVKVVIKEKSLTLKTNNKKTTTINQKVEVNKKRVCGRVYITENVALHWRCTETAALYVDRTVGTGRPPGARCLYTLPGNCGGDPRIDRRWSSSYLLSTQWRRTKQNSVHRHAVI